MQEFILCRDLRSLERASRTRLIAKRKPYPAYRSNAQAVPGLSRSQIPSGVNTNAF
ncbi:hypothetical protein [Scytonema sp. NUACC26]|uniref:hypothetical protein n=1 Tax=Scytonema sp. NUACC26 TaxID=3140176 RepID=UPI0038B31E71